MNRHIPEVTPEWLRNLLFKYGLDEGILDGVPSDSQQMSSTPPDFNNAPTDISGVLNQLAETLPHGTARLPTSVDWGDKTPAESETPSSAMDELLASLRGTEEAAEPAEPAEADAADQTPAEDQPAEAAPADDEDKGEKGEKGEKKED